MMDKYLIAALVVLVAATIGHYLDTVPNTVTGGNGRTRGKPLKCRDIREVYWIEDPIETRVTRAGPHPGTTGDIEPERAKQNMVVDGQCVYEGELYRPRQYGSVVQVHIDQLEYALRTDDDRSLTGASYECAICGAATYGNQRVCQKCFDERAGT